MNLSIAKDLSTGLSIASGTRPPSSKVRPDDSAGGKLMGAEVISASLSEDAIPSATVGAIDAVMREMMRGGHADLPRPGSGRTFRRWEALAAVAARNLSLAKIFESHADAQAILREFGRPVHADKLLAVWAAENPASPLVFDSVAGTLSGRKDWCSGATVVDEGLLSAQTPDGKKVLVHAVIRAPGVQPQPSQWGNPGMPGAGTTSIVFSEARACQLGGENAYLNRAGFWQGGAGIAAVWFGGAASIAALLADSPRVASDPHAAAHLGAVHGHLAAAHALLRKTADWIDENPAADAMVRALALRSVVEWTATETIRRTGRALGPAPLCTRSEHGQRVTDLEIFLRQSHAEKDLADLGRALTNADCEWRP